MGAVWLLAAKHAPGVAAAHFAGPAVAVALQGGSSAPRSAQLDSVDSMLALVRRLKAHPENVWLPFGFCSPAWLRLDEFCIFYSRWASLATNEGVDFMAMIHVLNKFDPLSPRPKFEALRGCTLKTIMNCL